MNSTLVGSIYTISKSHNPLSDLSKNYFLVLEEEFSEDCKDIIVTTITDNTDQENKNFIKLNSLILDNTNNWYVNLTQTFNLKEIHLDNKIGFLEKPIFSKLLKERILIQTRKYYKYTHEENFLPRNTRKERINYAGRVYDQVELENLIDSSLDFWLTSGFWTETFEKGLENLLGVHKALFVNSGSSANLLSFFSLTSHKLGDQKITRGDEVITIAMSFPTTVAPIYQFGAKPVFVDVLVEDGTYNINTDQLEEALTSKTKAVMLAHTLGNPFDLATVLDFCKKNHLWLIEDNCDALGSKYKGQMTGTFGDIGTSSFYPPHHITTGEGGAVYSNNKKLISILSSMRDWGRDCWCPSGKDNTCNARFKQKHGLLPKGYDHKYVYSHFGFNLKATDLQASIGVAQLQKIHSFTRLRKENWQALYDGLKHLEEFFVLPKATKHSDPSWFGFILTLRNNVPFKRVDLTNFLEHNDIQTRTLFAGNLIAHPAFDPLREDKSAYRVIGELSETNKVLHNTFWIGVYPGLNKEDIAYMTEKINDFCNNFN